MRLQKGEMNGKIRNQKRKHFTMYSRACASASFSGRLTALGRGTETEGAEEVRDSYGEFLKGIAGLYGEDGSG